MKRETDQNGNILFLILLAVVLFAALAYAVTSSMRGGGKNASSETVQANAAAIMQYASLMNNTITRLRLSNDCKDEQISFYNPIASGYAEAHSPASKKCHVFDPSGGGLTWMAPNPKWLDASKSAASDYDQFLFLARTCIGLMGSGTMACYSESNTRELIMFLPYVTYETCLEIQKKVYDGSIKTDNDGVAHTVKYDGNLSTSPGIALQNGNPPHLPTGCLAATGTGNNAYLPYSDAYVFYHVLVSR